MSDKAPSDKYELKEPVATILARFNHDAFFWGPLWAWSHGMRDWGLILYLAPSVMAVTAMGVWAAGGGPVITALILFTGYVGLLAYFAKRANHLLWQRDRDRFYEAFAVRPEPKPISVRERVTVAIVFAPFVVVMGGAIVWAFIEKLTGH